MNYLKEKKEILELKLRLTTCLLEKNHAIFIQSYQKAAELREFENQLFQTLQEKKNKLLEFQHSAEYAKQGTEKSVFLSNLLHEIQLQLSDHNIHEGYPFVRPHSEDIGDLERIHLERTQKLKNDILKKHNSGESE